MKQPDPGRPVQPSSSIFQRAVQILTRQGPRVLAIKAYNRLRRVDYNQLFKACRLRLAADSEKRRALSVLSPDPDTAANSAMSSAAAHSDDSQKIGKTRFSIIVPLYNTDPVFLAEMIESVRQQEYPDWQLCLADGSDAEHPEVETTGLRYATLDARINYRKLDHNLGISGNTNAALAMAEGNFIALLDHDDLLAPEALAEVNEVILSQQADLIYSDELNFTGNLDAVKLIHFKPDFAIDNLRSNNYICHLTVFAKALSDQIGEFDSACDGSQDYDYILRLSEKAEKIVHIPKILYYWRIHGRSVASDISVKPYCLDAARLALTGHLQRCGLAGVVENGSILSSYRIRYAVDPAARVLVLITVHARNQLPILLRQINQPTDLPTEYRLVMPDHVLPESAARQHWLKLFQTNQACCKRPSVCSLVGYGRSESLAAVLNREVLASTADYLAFLDGSVISLSRDWLTELVMFAQRPDVGAASGKIICRGVILQAGLATGIAGSLGAYHHQRVNGEPGYMARLTFANNVSAVDRTCMVLARQKFIDFSGFDEHYQRDFFDLDLCLRMRAEHLVHVFSPYAEITVKDSRHLPLQMLKRQSAAIPADINLFSTIWQAELQRPDPYYNPNFNSAHTRFDQR